MLKFTEIVSANFEGGGGKKFFNPQYLPNFGDRKLKIYEPLDFHGLHLACEFCDSNPKNRTWKTIVEIKNFNCPGGCRFRIKIQFRGLKEH